MIIYEKKCTNKKLMIFGEKLMHCMEQIEIHLRNQNPKKNSLATLNEGYPTFLKGFRGGSGARPCAAKKIFYCRFWLAISSGGTPYGEG